VYETPVNTVEELTIRVNNAAEAIRKNSDMFDENSSFCGSKGTQERASITEGVILNI
jgi:hypothetical protein